MQSIPNHLFQALEAGKDVSGEAGSELAERSEGETLAFALASVKKEDEAGPLPSEALPPVFKPLKKPKKEPKEEVRIGEVRNWGLGQEC